MGDAHADTSAAERRIESLEQQVVRLQEEASAGWGNYHQLRRRRVVRAGLALTALRDRLLGRGTAAPPPQPEEEEVRHPWPLGHFYSPVPDTRELSAEPARSRVWPPTPKQTVGIDWRPAEQLALVESLGRQPRLDLAEAPTGDPTEYHTQNEQFPRLDAWVLQGMLRHLEPARMIEVGCGWSSLVSARVNRDCLGQSMDLTCIEPYPPDFLQAGVPGISRLIQAPVQEVAHERFAELGAGDVLFIDTSHVVKTGNDVQYLYEEVVPRLAEGVVIHIHDIFLPWEYPQEWVLEGRGWNEQYLVRAFLSFNQDFEVLLGVGWMAHTHPELFASVVPGLGDPRQNGGGSLWIRRRRSTGAPSASS